MPSQRSAADSLGGMSAAHLVAVAFGFTTYEGHRIGHTLVARDWQVTMALVFVFWLLYRARNLNALALFDLLILPLAIGWSIRVGSSTLRFGDVSQLASVILLAINVGRRRTPLPPAVLSATLCSIAVGVFGVANAGSSTAALPSFIIWAVLIPVLLAVSARAAPNPDPLRVIRAMGMSSVAAMLGVCVAGTLTLLQAGQYDRVSMRMAVPAIACVVITVLRERALLPAWVVMPVLAAVMLDGSRQTLAFFGLTAALGVVRSIGRLLRMSRVRGIVALMLACIAVWSLAPRELVATPFARLMDGGSSAATSNSLRERSAELAIASLESSQVFGHGFGSYALLGRLSGLRDPNGTSIDSPHSEWLFLAAETGMAGVVAFAIFLLALLYPVITARGARSESEKVYYSVLRLCAFFFLLIITFGDWGAPERTLLVCLVVSCSAYGTRENMRRSA